MNIPGAKPVEVDEIQSKSILGFNLLGGELDWNALEAVAEYLEIKEIDLFIDNLIQLREYQASKK